MKKNNYFTTETVWPDNIAAERHERSGRWVLRYLTDEQAKKCHAAMTAAKVED